MTRPSYDTVDPRLRRVHDTHRDAQQHRDDLFPQHDRTKPLQVPTPSAPQRPDPEQQTREGSAGSGFFSARKNHPNNTSRHHQNVDEENRSQFFSDFFPNDDSEEQEEGSLRGVRDNGSRESRNMHRNNVSSFRSPAREASRGESRGYGDLSRYVCHVSTCVHACLYFMHVPLELVSVCARAVR